MHALELQTIANLFHQEQNLNTEGIDEQLTRIKEILKKAAEKGEYETEVPEKLQFKVIQELRRDGYKVKRFSKVTVREGGAWSSEKVYRISWKLNALIRLILYLTEKLTTGDFFKNREKKCS